MNFFIKAGNLIKLITQSRISNVSVGVDPHDVVTVGQLNQYVDTSSSYKKYVATLTQTGTNAPVATVLENTLGSITWSYDSTGWYLGTLTGAFATASKVVVFVGNQFFVRETGGIIITKEVVSDRNDENSIFVGSAKYDGVASGNVLDNAVLNNTPIEIRVYN